MNDKLIQIDDDALDQVAGGLTIQIGLGGVGRVVEGAVGAVKDTLDFVGGAAKGLLGLIPSIKISFGRR